VVKQLASWLELRSRGTHATGSPTNYFHSEEKLDKPSRTKEWHIQPALFASSSAKPSSCLPGLVVGAAVPCSCPAASFHLEGPLSIGSAFYFSKTCVISCA